MSTQYQYETKFIEAMDDESDDREPYQGTY